MRTDGLDVPHVAHVVRVHDAADAFLVHVEERIALGVAGAAHEHVDPAEPGDSVGGCAVHAGRVRHVDLDRDHRSLARGSQLRECCVELRAAARADRDRRALPRELDRCGLSDPLGPADDVDPLALEHAAPRWAPP
jgi:hypothetical protein